MVKLLDNRYRVIRHLGAGGMAQVLLVKDEKLDREVALKFFTDKAPPPDKIRRFRYECESIRNFNHHNLVKLLDFGNLDEGHPYYTMEFLPYPSLEDVMKKGRLDKDYVANVLEQVLVAFEQFHPLGIVHRDIKPANILVSDEGRVVLVDFGLAHDPNRTTLTKTGQFVGTPEFLAPEQLIEAETDERTDLYQLGLVAYKMLSGKRAFEGQSLQEYLVNLQTGKYRPIKRFVPTISRAWEAFIDKCLAPSPATRFQNAKEVKEALEQVRTGSFEKEAGYDTVATNVVLGDGSGSGAIDGIKHIPRYAWVFALCLLALLPLWRFGFSSKETKIPLTGTMLRQPVMVALNELHIKYEGPREDTVELSFSSTKSEEQLLQTTSVSLKMGKPLSRSIWALPFRFQRPPLSTFSVRIRCGRGLDATFSVNPSDAIDGLLDPVDGLTRRDLGKLLLQCQTVLLEFLRQSKGDSVHFNELLMAQLDKGGLSKEEVEELVRWLPKVLDDRVVANSPLAKRLLPLRYLEAILCSSERTVELPWGLIAPRIGITCQRTDPLPSHHEWFIAANVDLRQGVDKKVLDVAPALWLAEDYTRQQFSAMGGIAMVEGMMPQNLITAIKASQTEVTKTIDVAFPSGKDKKTLVWFLDLLAWEWQPSIGLSLQINEEPPFLLLKGILPAERKKKSLAFNAQWFSVKLPRGFFTASENRLKFKIFTLPGQQCKTALGTEKLRLRCQ